MGDDADGREHQAQATGAGSDLTPSPAAAACVLLPPECVTKKPKPTAGPEGNSLPRVDPERPAAEGPGRERVIAPLDMVSPSRKSAVFGGRVQAS